jgi:DNA polymerase III sliding clamp (beta) subunit (PCNA family)
MDKKIIKSMFDNICAKDVLRPIMNGIHFEENRCYASDGHILIIYNESVPRLKDKTILLEGMEIDGRYPNVDSVLPSENAKHTEMQIDVEQLKNACIWHSKKPSAMDVDRVVICGVGLNVNTLLRFLKTVSLFGKEQTFAFYDRLKSVLVEGENFKGIIMPMEYNEKDIDAESEFNETCTVYSYENFINDYVFNSWKDEASKKVLSWLD